tara:strand:- start:374 stop:1756 length:1383 start_codon:yes stop_codon:yes gene_type:complete
MGKQTINVGSTANDGTGSTIRVGGQITNSNFTEIYTGLGDGSTLSFDLNTQTPTDGQALVYNAASGKFRPGTATATATFTVAGDGGSDQSITTGSDTLTIQGGTGITTTGVATDILSVAIDGTVTTLTGSQTLTNKNLTASTNTFNPITFVDDSSTASTIGLGETLKISGGTGLTSAVSGDTLTLNLDNTAVSAASYGSSTAIPVITIDGQGRITNASTANISTDLSIVDDSSTAATISLLSDTLKVAGGLGITSSISGDTLTIGQDTAFASSYLNAVATIDVTNSGASAYLFNSHYSGNNPTLYFKPGVTYSFNLNVSGHPFHLQTVSGAYASGSPYTTGLTHVATDGTVSTGASALLKVSGTLFYEVPTATNTTIYYVCQNHSAMQGKIVIGNITDRSNTGDGSTTAFTINSGRTVDDLIVIVNGITLVPTDDYTVSGTTLTFQTAPADSAEIVIRYL